MKDFHTPHKDSSRITPDEHQHITVDKLKSLLPTGTNIAVTEEITNLINNMEEDSGLPQNELEEDLMTHMHLVGSMRGVGIKDLINAIKYANLTRYYTNKESWSIVFPDKYNRLVESNKQVDNHVSMYNNNKLVTAILKDMLIPVHLMYSKLFHEGVRELYNIGVKGKGGKNAEGQEMTVTPMVRVQALKELTTITKAPEEQKLSININPGEEALSMQEEMNDQLAALVSMQKKQLDRGADIIDVQQIGINFDSIKSSGQ